MNRAPDTEHTCLAVGPTQFTPPHQTRQNSPVSAGSGAGPDYPIGTVGTVPWPTKIGWPTKNIIDFLWRKKFSAEKNISMLPVDSRICVSHLLAAKLAMTLEQFLTS